MAENSKRQTLFDQWSGQYDRDVSDGGFPFIGYEHTLDTLVEWGEFAVAHKVLDVGIGTGNLAMRLPLPPENVWGIDFSREMLVKAEQNLPGSHLLQVDLLAEDWPVEISQPFNRIISGYTLHEFRDGKKITILKRLAHDSLAPGGMLMIADISFPDPAKFEAGRSYFMSEGSWDEEEFYWCADVLLGQLQNEGFRPEYVQTSPCAGVYRLCYG